MKTQKELKFMPANTNAGTGFLYGARANSNSPIIIKARTTAGVDSKGPVVLAIDAYGDVKTAQIVRDAMHDSTASYVIPSIDAAINYPLVYTTVVSGSPSSSNLWLPDEVVGGNRVRYLITTTDRFSMAFCAQQSSDSWTAYTFTKGGASMCILDLSADSPKAYRRINYRYQCLMSEANFGAINTWSVADSYVQTGNDSSYSAVGVAFGGYPGGSASARIKVYRISNI